MQGSYSISGAPGSEDAAVVAVGCSKDAEGRYLADAGLLLFSPTGGGGTLLGFRFATTTQIPIDITTGTSTDTTDVYFSSDWQECWIGENEEFGIELSREAAYTVDGTNWNSAFQQEPDALPSGNAPRHRAATPGSVHGDGVRP